MYLKHRTISVAFVLSLVACTVSATSWVYAQSGGEGGGGSGGGGSFHNDVHGNVVMEFDNGELPPAHPFWFSDVRILRVRRCIDGTHLLTVRGKKDTGPFTVLVPRVLTSRISHARVGAHMSGHSSERSSWCVLSTSPLIAESSMLLDSVK